MVMTIASVWGNDVRSTSLVVNVMGMWDHLVWVIGPLTAT
jgi:hypothetical protein